MYGEFLCCVYISHRIGGGRGAFFNKSRSIYFGLFISKAKGLLAETLFRSEQV